MYKSVKVFDLSLWVGKAGDVTDFLATDTFPDLEKVVDSTPQIQDVSDIDKFLGTESSDDERFIRMSSVEGNPNVEFLWYPYIPLGKVTILDGDPGVGKSFLLLAVAAAISNGKTLEDAIKNASGKR